MLNRNPGRRTGSTARGGRRSTADRDIPSRLRDGGSGILIRTLPNGKEEDQDRGGGQRAASSCSATHPARATDGDDTNRHRHPHQEQPHRPNGGNDGATRRKRTPKRGDTCLVHYEVYVLETIASSTAVTTASRGGGGGGGGGTTTSDRRSAASTSTTNRIAAPRQVPPSTRLRLVDSTYRRDMPLKVKLGGGRPASGADNGNAGGGARTTGSGTVPGFEVALACLSVGDPPVEATVPSLYGYGAAGCPPSVPPHATLVFRMELVDILP